jgi:hypothetical protein
MLNMLTRNASVNTQVGPAAIGEGRLLVTPGTAQRILEDFNYARQREVKARHVSKLAAQMKAGTWLEGSQIYFGRLPSGDMHLINGQHRLNAIIEANQAQVFQVFILAVKDESELRSAYYRLDVVQRSRGENDVLKGAQVAETLGVKTSIAAGAYRAAPFILNGMKYVAGVHRDNVESDLADGRLNLISDWATTIQLFQEVTAGAENDLRLKLASGGTMAAAMVTLKYQEKRAIPFWKGVANNEMLEKGDPRRTLILCLLDRNTRRAGAGLQFCAIAWNAWFQGRSLHSIRVYDTTKPSFLGTPYV